MKYLLLALTTLMISQIATAASFSVSPLFIDINTAENIKIPFEIGIKSDGPLKLNFSLYKATQAKSGKLEFIKVKSQGHIKFSKTKYTFRRKGLWVLDGVYTVSKKLKNSTDIYSIMIEEDLSQKRKGVNIQVRYAVVLKAENKKTRTYEKASLQNFKISKNTLSVDFSNQSVKQQKAMTTYNIRNKHNKIIHKGTLNSLSALQKSADKSIVFPLNTITLQDKLPSLESNETYQILIKSKINKKRSVVLKQTFLSPKHSKKVNTPKKEELLISPSKLNVELNKIKKGLFRFKVQNNYSKNRSFTLNSNIKSVRFIPKKVTLKPGASKYILIKALNHSPQKKDKFSLLEQNGKKEKSSKLNISFSKKEVDND